MRSITKSRPNVWNDLEIILKVHLSTIHKVNNDAHSGGGKSKMFHHESINVCNN